MLVKIGDTWVNPINVNMIAQIDGKVRIYLNGMLSDYQSKDGSENADQLMDNIAKTLNNGMKFGER